MASDDDKHLENLLKSSQEDHVTAFDKPPSLQSIFELIDQLEGVSDDERESMKQNVVRQMMGIGSPANETIHSLMSYEYLTLLALLLIVVCVVVFFGYKLIKSLQDKERKRDEKRKAKQLKKKK